MDARAEVIAHAPTAVNQKHPRAHDRSAIRTSLKDAIISLRGYLLERFKELHFCIW
jgi:hypothetical protein